LNFVFISVNVLYKYLDISGINVHDNDLAMKIGHSIISFLRRGSGKYKALMKLEIRRIRLFMFNVFNRITYYLNNTRKEYDF
jgi:hypothetical protein